MCGTVTITIDATLYTYEAQGGDDENAILSELKDLIDAGSFPGIVTLDTTADT